MAVTTTTLLSLPVHLFDHLNSVYGHSLILMIEEVEDLHLSLPCFQDVLEDPDCLLDHLFPREAIQH